MFCDCVSVTFHCIDVLHTCYTHPLTWPDSDGWWGTGQIEKLRHLLEISASDRFHDISIKMGQEGQMGQNKPSCSFPRVETIANRFLMNIYLRKVNFVLLEIPASDRFPDKSIKNGSSGTNGAK